jgi:hypothetical protein
MGCGEVFLAYKNQKFCSLECMYIHRDVVIKNSPKLQISLKQQYYSKYGFEEGERHWEEFRKKCRINTPKDANAEWRYLAKYGEEEGLRRYGVYLEKVRSWNDIQKTTTLDERLGHDRAEKFRERVRYGGKKRTGERNGSFGIPRYPKLRFVPEIDHNVRSAFEEDVGRFLRSIGVKYLYESLRMRIHVDGKLETYTPDFVVGNIIIEPKGFIFPHGFNKLKNIIETYSDWKFIVICEYCNVCYCDLLKKSNFILLTQHNYKRYLPEVLKCLQ